MKIRNEYENGSVDNKNIGMLTKDTTTHVTYNNTDVLTLQPEGAEQTLLKKINGSAEQLHQTEGIPLLENDVSDEQLNETECIEVKKNEVSAEKPDDTERISLRRNHISTLSPDGGWGWMIVLGSFLIHVITDGILYSFGIFYIEFLEYYNGGKGATAWIGSLAVGFQLLAGPLASSLTNRFGSRVTTIAGSVVAALGFVLSIFSPNLYFLYFSFGILSGIGFCLTYFPTIVSVGHYFEKKRTFAVGLASCGSGIGAFIFNPFSKYLIDMYGWRGALLIQAGLLLNCTLCGAIFRPLEKQKVSGSKIKVIEKTNGMEGNCALTRDDTTQQLPADYNDYPNTSQSLSESSSTSRNQHNAYKAESELNKKDNSKEQRLLSGNIAKQCDQYEELQHSKSDINKAALLVELEKKISVSEAFQDNKIPLCCVNVRSNLLHKMDNTCNLSPLKDVLFIMYLISNVLASLCLNIPFIFLYDRAVEQGTDTERAKWLGSVIGIVNTLGRVLSGILADKLKVNRLLLFNTTLTICGLATALCPLCSNYYLLVIFSCVFGLSFGIYIPLMSVVLVDILGLEMLSNSFGLLLMFKGMANLIGPPVAGWFYDGTGSYDIPFIVGGMAVALSGILLYPVTCIKRCRKNEELESGERCE